MPEIKAWHGAYLAQQSYVVPVLDLDPPAPKAASAAAADPFNIQENKQKTVALFNKVMSRLGANRRLSEEDAARYAHIFAFQDIGDFGKADHEIAKLDDRRLIGHVLYQRYMHADYKASYAELADWMKHYADHPNAQRVYDLALRRKPDDAKAPKAPKVLHGVLGQRDFDVLSVVSQNAISNAAGKSKSSADSRHDAVQAEAAETYFYNGNARKALELAGASADRSGAEVPKAGWIAGLSAWKLGQYGRAARYFETAADSSRASVWMAAAAAHWTARSYLRAHQPDQVSKWLERSAQYPRTFYGIISMKMLGQEQESFSWDMPSFGDRDAKKLAATPLGQRALALVDAERPDLAEQELSRLNPGKDQGLQKAMIALANEGGMPWVAMRMGSAFLDDDESLYDAALYPDVPWEPEHGFAVDKALVYAFIRQESEFDPNARNKSSGAVGLMQLMPATAKHVAEQSGEKIEANRLQDPILNIDLGQRYLAELLDSPVVDNNLFKLAVAYNAGPGKLARWSKDASYEDDPLFFIEAIPAAETRIFVERVLTNYWIYRMKFDQDTESLDRVAEGEWPTYVAQDIRRGSRFAAAEGFFSLR